MCMVSNNSSLMRVGRGETTEGVGESPMGWGGSMGGYLNNKVVVACKGMVGGLRDRIECKGKELCEGL